MSLSGKLQYFESKVDGKQYPYAVCATDDSEKPKPLIVEVSPQAYDNLPRCVELTEKIAAIAVKHGESCVVLRATGRGNGLCQHYCEIDVFEAIEDVKAHYAIDPDKISITGFSMGGAGVWYLISHYPDYFSAAVPWSGYCDYRLWQKVGGLTVHMDEWEEPAWISKSAVFLLENLQYTPVWMVHGEWDRAPAGVPVQHSRQMATLMTQNGYDCKYTELQRLGHDTEDGVFEETIIWLIKQKKLRSPRHLAHTAYTLRHNSSYWASIEQFENYYGKAVINAQIVDKRRIEITTDNVKVFALSNPDTDETPDVKINGFLLPTVDLYSSGIFVKNGPNNWSFEAVKLSQGKRRTVSGPIGDMFFDNVLLVPGTTGTEEESYFLDYFATVVAPVYYRKNNGGVHRGGTPGENVVKLTAVKDIDITDNLLCQNNLILYGTHLTNSIIARLKDDLPISFGEKSIRVCNKEYSAEYCTVFAVLPHPFNPNRYIAIHGGVAPDSIVWGGMLNMNLLPDYIVYSKTKVLGWGFFNNEWKIAKE